LPVNTWKMRKCKECGKLFYNSMGDCISASGLMIRSHSLCNECFNKTRPKDNEFNRKKKGFFSFDV